MHRSATTIISGAIIGFGVGLVVGLLFAPVSGATCRKRLAQEALSAADTVRVLIDKAEDVVCVLEAKVGKFKGADEDDLWRRVQDIRSDIRLYESRGRF